MVHGWLSCLIMRTVKLKFMLDSRKSHKRKWMCSQLMIRMSKDSVKSILLRRLTKKGKNQKVRIKLFYQHPLISWLSSQISNFTVILCSLHCEYHNIYHIKFPFSKGVLLNTCPRVWIYCVQCMKGHKKAITVCIWSHLFYGSIQVFFGGSLECPTNLL